VLLGAASIQVFAQEGGAPNPAAQQRAAAQLALEKSYPQLQITDQFLHLSVPGQTMGESVGVAENSKGHLFVYNRTENQGPARGGKAAKLWEFDNNYKFVKEWGPNNYGESFAHVVRVDPSDNVWSVDEGSGMIVKYNPQGQHVFWLGRVPEAIDYMESNIEILHKYNGASTTKPAKPVGNMSSFNRETDIAWDTSGNSFVSDGYGNSRVVKIGADGHWEKAVGTNGNGKDQFSTPHGIGVDAKNNVYVADRGNFRIQVYDDNLNFVRSITGIGAPWSICISKGATQYMFTGDGNGKLYKMDMTGKVLGMAQTGLGHGQESELIHTLDCRNPNVVFIGSASLWDVQQVTIKN
jgi:hypothetical protein